MHMINNLLKDIPADLTEEVFDDLLKTDAFRVERIVSNGHSSPDEGWYDQTEHEWVLVLEGFGVLEFEDGTKLKLTPGQSVNIPAHTKHKVQQTDPAQPTIWLAIFYK